MRNYGGFWLRFVAYIIDTIVLAIVGGALGGILGFGVGAIMTESENTTVTSSLGAGGLSLVVNWLYNAILESSTWQATVGKKALSLVVTDESGQRISFGRASGRYFAKIASTTILLFGFFVIGWTERKRGLHDMLAGTLVFKANSPELVRTNVEIFS
jgi:uncharacterized RDD family membrane protein YckC